MYISCSFLVIKIWLGSNAWFCVTFFLKRLKLILLCFDKSTKNNPFYHNTYDWKVSLLSPFVFNHNKESNAMEFLEDLSNHTSHLRSYVLNRAAFCLKFIIRLLNYLWDERKREEAKIKRFFKLTVIESFVFCIGRILRQIVYMCLIKKESMLRRNVHNETFLTIMIDLW